MAKKVIRLTEEELHEMVKDSTKKILEDSGMLLEMARVGYMGKKGEFEVYVRTDDPGNIPHFHLRDSATQGREFETCIELKKNKYFLHGGYTGVLNSSQRKCLADFMESPNQFFGNNYGATVYAWNTNNSSENIEIEKDGHGAIIMPDYRTIYK